MLRPMPIGPIPPETARIPRGTLGGRSFSSAELRQIPTECGARRTEVGAGLPVGFVVGYRG
jgi:hypothetical protein